MTRLILILAIVGVVVWLFREALRRWNTVFRIEVRSGRFELTGTIPGRPWSEIRPFLSTLPLPTHCHIAGVRDGKRFRLFFSGSIDEGTKQRIRNFLFLS